jgi:hypothetical protein
MSRSLSAQVAALPKLTTADLIARYEELVGEPPPIVRRAWVLKRVAWHTQAAALGGLSDKAQERLEHLIDLLPKPKRDAPSKPVPGIRPTASLTAGTILRKRYKGEDIVVRVLEDGFEHAGVTYPSLTAVAKAVTGSTSMNGRMFFGLTKRSRKR